MSDLEDDDAVKKNLPMGDGFDGFENDSVKGEGQKKSNKRIIQGHRLGFTIDYKWLVDDDKEFPKTGELVAIETCRLVQKWVSGVPVGHIFLTSDEPWPNVDAMNEKCPRSEWGEYNGKPQGPYQKQRLVYFVDLDTMQKYTWPSRVETIGADICVREFREKVRLMRQFRGERVFAMVALADTYMSTRFGGRQRPELKVTRWLLLGSEGKTLPAPSAPTLQQANPTSAPEMATTPAKGASLPGTVTTVSEPSLGEIMGDEILPFDDPIDLNTPKAASPPVQHKPPPGKPTITKKGVQKVA